MHSEIKSMSGNETAVLINSSDLQKRIRNLLAWQFGIDAGVIKTHTELVNQLYADSLDLLETIHVMNREFEIEIEPEQLADIRSVGDIECVVAAMMRH